MKSARTALLLTSAVGALWLSGACDTPTEGPGAPAQLEVPGDILTLRQGSTQRIIARVLDAEGQIVPGVPITFTSGDPGIVTVSQSGLLLGIRGGATTVLVAAAGFQTSVSVTVFGHPAGAVAATTPLGGRPFAVAVSPAGVLYVGRQDDARVERGTLPATTFSASVAVGSVPTDVAFTSDGSTAFVTNQLSRTVGVIAVASNTQVQTVALPADPFRVLVSRDDQEVYVSANDGNIYILTQSGSAMLARRPARTAGARLQSIVNGMALHPTAAVLYVSTLDGLVGELSLTTRQLVRVFDIGGLLQDVAVTSDGAELFVARESGSLAVVTLATGAVSFVPGVVGSFSLKISPDDARVYLTVPASDRLLILDRVSRAVLDSIPTGDVPRRLAFDRYGTMAVLATEFGGVHFIR